MAGLGNPGRRYEETRHNVGFRVVDELARRWGVCLDRRDQGAMVAKALLGSQRVLLAEPQGFMNRSGGPVAALARWNRVPPEQILVVHDDLDLPFGTVRLKARGGHGGHNGLRDIQAHMGEVPPRVRVGISRPPAGMESTGHVLGRWSDQEREGLDDVVSQAADAVVLVIEQGMQAAMNVIHRETRRSDEPETPPRPIGAED